MKSATWMMVALSFSLAAGCTSPIVGIGCEQGYSMCGGTCVALDSDPMNCGACGVVCAMSACHASACVGGELADGSWMPSDASWMGGDGLVQPDASAWPADADAGVVGDAGPGAVDAGASDVDAGASEVEAGASDVDAGASDVDAGAGASDVDSGMSPPVCDLGESICDGDCARVGSDAMNCGACGVICDDGSVCSDGACTATCGADLTLCGSRCVDTTRSDTDCGGCGITCYTGVCADSVCIEGYAGHLVVIGHDYTASRGPMQQLLSNALGLGAARTMPRVLHFTGWATASSIAGVAAAMTHARPVISTYETDPLEVPLALATSDVLLVYAMHDAIDEEIGGTGLVWSRALQSFLQHGGVVIALDAPSDVNVGGAGRWLDAAGLATFVPHEDASGDLLDVVAPADALVVGLPLSYRAETWSTHWIASELPVVIADGTTGVVLHRTISP